MENMFLVFSWPVGVSAWSSIREVHVNSNSVKCYQFNCDSCGLLFFVRLNNILVD